MSSLSVAVLRLGPDADFETTLASVLRYRLPHHQVMAVTSAEQFRDYGLENEADFPVCREPASYWNFLKCAMRCAAGEFLIALMPGVEVHHQWFAAGIRALRAEGTASASFPIGSDKSGDDRLVCGIGMRPGFRPAYVSLSGKSIEGPAMWAAAWRVDVLRKYAPALEPLCDSLAPLEIALAARRQGWKCTVAGGATLVATNPLPVTLAAPYLLGQYAARLQHRYARQLLSLAARIGNRLRMVSGLVSPAGWMFAAGSHFAKRDREQDLEYAARLALVGTNEVNAPSTAEESRLRAA